MCLTSFIINLLVQHIKSVVGQYWMLICRTKSPRKSCFEGLLLYKALGPTVDLLYGKILHTVYALQLPVCLLQDLASFIQSIYRDVAYPQLSGADGRR